SSRSWPAMASRMIAASRALRVIGPMWSRLGARPKMPCLDTRPHVGLRPVTPLAADGRRIDPPVAEPREPKDRPAAVATADPLEDTPDRVAVAQGLTGVGRSGGGPVNAPSVRRSLPRITAPARRSRATTVASV